MTYVISEPCIDVNERSCMDVCPVDCIHEAGRMLVIDPGECIDCGACEAECPVDAIYPADSLPSHLVAFVEINAAIAVGADAAARAAGAYADGHELPAIPGYRP